MPPILGVIGIRRRGLLAGTPFAGRPMPLQLSSSGPGYCLHQPLREHSTRTRALHHWITTTGASYPDRLSGQDAVHCDAVVLYSYDSACPPSREGLAFLQATQRRLASADFAPALDAKTARPGVTATGAIYGANADASSGASPVTRALPR